MTQTEDYVATKEPSHNTGGSSMTELLSGILTDAQTLIRQQVGLIRAEFVEDLRRTKQIAKCFAIGALFLLVGIVMLLVAGVHLVQYLTGWPEWAAWASVGVTTIILGIVAIVVGSRILAKHNPLPDKSFHALQENVSCLTNPPK